MKRIIFAISALAMAFGFSLEGFAWGRDAHAAVAYIAECNLTPRAKANIEKCIDGHSIVYYSSWLDYHRKEHKAWDRRRHTCDFDTDGNPIGRPLKHMHEMLDNLSNYENLTDSARKFNIYALVHVMGDYHCPGHLEYRTPDGKTKLLNSFYNVRYLKEKKPRNYHQIWDTMVITANHSDWGYMDFAHALNNIPQSEKDAITAGNVEDWLRDTERASKIIFEKVPKPKEDAEFDELPLVDKQTLNDFGDLACEQVLKAGLRLAKVLNDIFDK